jgi:hypothetical protein
MLMQLSIGLYFTSFISIAVLRLGLSGSVHSVAVFNFLLYCRKIETMSKFRGLFTLSLDREISEVVNCNSVVVDR